MSSAATTTLSSKGQVVIPEEIRIQLGLEPGAQFVVIADRDVVIFKLLEPPSLKDFSALVSRARKVAKQTGHTRADLLHGTALRTYSQTGYGYAVEKSGAFRFVLRWHSLNRRERKTLRSLPKSWNEYLPIMAL